MSTIKSRARINHFIDQFINITFFDTHNNDFFAHFFWSLLNGGLRLGQVCGVCNGGACSEHQHQSLTYCERLILSQLLE